jgi:hypothetical protein
VTGPPATPGSPGQTGNTGGAGPTGPTGAAGTARAYGDVNGTTVRFGFNVTSVTNPAAGTYCLTLPGITVGTTLPVVTPDWQTDAVGEGGTRIAYTVTYGGPPSGVGCPAGTFPVLTGYYTSGTFELANAGFFFAVRSDRPRAASQRRAADPPLRPDRRDCHQTHRRSRGGARARALKSIATSRRLPARPDRLPTPIVLARQKRIPTVGPSLPSSGVGSGRWLESGGSLCGDRL